MLFRILVRESGGVSTIGVHGRLTWDSVDELRRVYSGSRGTVELDLADLLDADAVGAAYLQGLAEAGTAVRRANPHIRALLSLSGSPNPSQ